MKMRKNVWHLVATCLAVTRRIASKLDRSTSEGRETRRANNNLHSKDISAFASEILYQRSQDAWSMNSQNNSQQRSAELPWITLRMMPTHSSRRIRNLFGCRVVLMHQWTWSDDWHAILGPTLRASENSWSRMKQHVNHTSWPNLSQEETYLQ